MNKIEKAIYDSKLRLEDLQLKRIILNAEVKLIDELKLMLETIEKDDAFLHQLKTK